MSTEFHARPEFRDVLDRILARYPSLVPLIHRLGLNRIGISLAVMPRQRVNLAYHAVVEDEAFKNEVLKLIQKHDLPYVADVDGVLVISSID